MTGKKLLPVENNQSGHYHIMLGLPGYVLSIHLNTTEDDGEQLNRSQNVVIGIISWFPRPPAP